jgi:hypothetical protein
MPHITMPNGEYIIFRGKVELSVNDRSQFELKADDETALRMFRDSLGLNQTVIIWGDVAGPVSFEGEPLDAIRFPSVFGRERRG